MVLVSTVAKEKSKDWFHGTIWYQKRGWCINGGDVCGEEREERLGQRRKDAQKQRQTAFVPSPILPSQTSACTSFQNILP